MGKPSENMKWWTGQEVENIEKTKVKVHTLLDAFNDMVVLPKRDAAKAMRTSKSCTGKVFTVEMHHKNQPIAGCGDNVGMNMKGLSKENMPRVGDVMVLKTDDSLCSVGNFHANVQILDHPGQLKVGYTPIAFVRTGRAAIRMAQIVWKIGKSTGGQKANDPVFVKANEMAQIKFEPQQPFVCDSFKQCEGLGRIAIMEGNGVVMLGKVVKCKAALDKK